jgi:hypothetical protein
VSDLLPRRLLRLEGAAVLVGALALYLEAGNPWWAFLALFLLPDVAFLAYAAGPRVGASVYDVLHWEALPVALAVTGVLTGSSRATALGLVWLAHIGLDRAVGYGLKYPSSARETHLQRV